jgi:hypothetical protein
MMQTVRLLEGAWNIPFGRRVLGVVLQPLAPDAAEDCHESGG